MNAPPRKTVDRRPSTVNAPKAHAGFEIIWTNHAAKRMVQRQFDPDEVMEAIAHLCASGHLSKDKPSTITHGKFKVVAKETTEENPRRGNVGARICLIITVTYAGRGLNVPRHKRKRSRNQELRSRRRH